MAHKIFCKANHDFDEDDWYVKGTVYIICDDEEYDPGDPDDPDDYYIPDWTPDWLYDFLDSTGINYEEVADSIFAFDSPADAAKMKKAIKEFNNA
jgi:hypothetical protein